MEILHAPQRLSGETTYQYRSRRAASKAEARITERGTPNRGPFRQHTNPEKHAARAQRRALTHAGSQHPTPPATRAHKPINAAEANRKASPEQRKALARRKAMGIALIQRPLRHIETRTTTEAPDAKGVMRKVKSADFKLARLAADQGRAGATWSCALRAEC